MAATTKKSAAAPAKAEAKNAPVEFDYQGQHYTIAREAADNLEIFEDVEDNNLLRATRGFLGVKQWDAWKNSQRGEDGRVPLTAFSDFLDAVMAAIGGNS